MISGEERHEAAESLKRYAHDQLQGGLLNTLKLVAGTGGTWRDVLLRLADLIEPGDGPGRQAPCSGAMRAEADRLMWERHDCDGTARELRLEADRVDAACAPVDRDALLAIAGDLEAMPPGYTAKGWGEHMAGRIREACGEAVGRG